MAFLKFLGKFYAVLIGACMSIGIFSMVSDWIWEKREEYEYRKGWREYNRTHPWK